MALRSWLILCLLVLVIAACSTSHVDSERNVTPLSPNASPVQTRLNAGEIDDNEGWQDYLAYRRQFLPSAYLVHDVNVTQRHVITVTDPQGLPILGARVMVYAGQELITESRTYATGSTLFFPSAWNTSAATYRVVVQKDDIAAEFELDSQQANTWHLTLDVNDVDQSTQLDVLFLLDATGSMGDEIAQLQGNILSISEHINQFSGDVDVRYGLVTYRDRGDQYVTRSHDFVDDVNDFQSILRDVEASGGGDGPESLNEALHAATREVNWRGEDAIQLIFLVADAPPHLDYPNDEDYAQEMAYAAWQGIKIHPIASSGLPVDGEFIFRQLAQYTMGRFIFLTYDGGSSGEPGTDRDDLAAGQGNYSVEELDELVLKLITDEINALTTPLQPDGSTPQVASIAPQPEHAIPAAFALVPEYDTATVSLARANVVHEPSDGDSGITLSISTLLTISMGCVLAGFLLNNRKRKRKNDEDYFFD